MMDKKKRHVSGSRSRSKRSKPNDFSVELKPHKSTMFVHSHEQSKVKTENSLNKSKGSRKHSKQLKKGKQKCHENRLTKGSKDVSRSLSAERKQSLSKMNRTEANFQQEDIERRIYMLKKTLNRIKRPASISSKEIINYYRQIQESIETISEPLYSLLCYFHELYLFPIHGILEMISPYEQLLRKKQELSKSVEEQVKLNEDMYKKMDEEDLIIIRLKQKIEEQRQQIEEKKKLLKKSGEAAEKKPIISDGNATFSNEGIVRKMTKDRQRMITIERNSSVQFSEESNDGEEQKKTDPPQQSEKKKDGGLGFKGLKLDFTAMNRNETLAFHDQFYSKIDEFSESWREQALRQKKF